MTSFLALLLFANPADRDDVPPASPEQLAAWVVYSMARVFRDTAPPEEPVTELHLSALRNEYESAQVAVRATVPTRAHIAVTSLSRVEGDESLAGDCVTVRTVGYVPVRKNTPSTPATELDRKAPADFPDPLLPTNSAMLEPGVTQPFWLTFRIPAEAEPGLYRGTVQIVTDLGAASVPLEVVVRDAVLTAERHLWMTNWISPNALARFLGVPAWSEPVWEALPAYARNMAEHRQNVILTPLELILPTRRPDGSLSFDFTRFDRWVNLFRDAGVIGRIEGSHVGKRKGKWTSPTFQFRPVKAVNDPAEPAPSDADAKALLLALRDHLQEKGWLDAYLQHVADEPTQYNYASWRRLSEKIHRWAPELRRIEALHSPNLGENLEIWVPQLDLFHRDRAAFEARARRPGAELWFYTCMYPRGLYANRFIDYPLVKTRVLPWLARRLNCRGYLHWGYNFWSEEPFGDVERSGLPPGDSFVVYPGRHGPIDSIRWEILREGIEDFETLWLLDQAGGRAPADMLCRRVAAGPTAFEREIPVHEQAREALQVELARRRRSESGRDAE